MYSEMFKNLLVILFIHIWCVHGLDEDKHDVAEARGKAKYALLMHFAYVVATKLFVLKLIYGALFYVLICKAWKFVIWFIHYLKEKKPEYHHEYIEHDHHEHGHEYYEEPYHGYKGYGKPDFWGGKPDISGYQPEFSGYRDTDVTGYGKPEFSGYGKPDDDFFYKRKVYDSDGSYSIKQS